MNLRANNFKSGLLLGVLAFGCAALAVLAQTEPATNHPAALAPAPVATNAVAVPTNVLRSVFVVPTTETEGRDPFFPDSSPQVAQAPTATPGQAAETTRAVELSLQGFSGSGEHRLAIINERSFSAGEQGIVSTGSGRIGIRCIELKTNSVIVEVGGERRELRFRKN